MNGRQRLNIPVPDPTTLTTLQLRRELSGLRELIETRLDAMDAATDLLRTRLAEMPAAVDREIAHSLRFIDERFRAVDLRFHEREQRFSQEKTAAILARDAGLAAQKDAAAAMNQANRESVAKSEASTLKQMDGIGTQLRSVAGALTDKIDAINARLNRGEGVSTGHATSQATLIAIAAVIATMASVAVNYVSNHSHDDTPPSVYQIQPYLPRYPPPPDQRSDAPRPQHSNAIARHVLVPPGGFEI